MHMDFESDSDQMFFFFGVNSVWFFVDKFAWVNQIHFYNIANDSMSNGELLGLGYTTFDNFCKIAKLGHVTKYGHVAQLIHQAMVWG